MAEQDEIRHDPPEAFEEHLTLPKDKILDIQAEAATNTNRNLNQNEGNATEPTNEAEPPPK